MPNPALRSNPFDAAPPPDAGNGDLAKIGGDFIAMGSQQLPKAGPGEQAQREVVLSGVPRFGMVRITYELSRYRHGRSERWHWLAVRADAITLGLPVSAIRDG